MRRFYLVGFLVLTTFDTVGQVGFKLAAMATAPPDFDLPWLQRVLFERWIYLAVLGYRGAFFTYMTLLRHAPIGPAFAASHLEIVSVLIVSVWMMGETLSGWQVMGAVLILMGIALLVPKRERRHGETEKS